MTEVGSKVFAIESSDNETVRLFGFGVYEGDKPYPGIDVEGFTNPCILLENGDRVFGLECWWGPIEKFEKMFSGLKIENVPVPSR